MSNTANLLDHLITTRQLKNDAGLSRAIEVAPPIISKLRSGKFQLGAVTIIRIHEAFDMPIREIKERAGL